MIALNISFWDYYNYDSCSLLGNFSKYGHLLPSWHSSVKCLPGLSMIGTPLMLVCKYVNEIGLTAMLATKRSAGVAPEVNLRKYTLCMSPWSVNKAGHSSFENRDATRSLKQGYQWPHKRTWVHQFGHLPVLIVCYSSVDLGKFFQLHHNR